MSARAPRLILGNMTFGWSQSSSFVDSNIAEAMLSAFMASGGRSLDTARIYAGGSMTRLLNVTATAYLIHSFQCASSRFLNTDI